MKAKTRVILCLGTVAAIIFATAAGQRDSGSAGGKPLYRIDLFSVYANYNGLQGGWFGKIIKDKFNIEINIITAKADAEGEAIYQTRAASGNLGDMVQDDASRMADQWKVGLLQDMAPYLANTPNITKRLKTAYEATSKKFFDGKGVYALPTSITDKKPTDPAMRGLEPEIGVYVLWDKYLEAGAPEVKTLDDLLTILGDIQRKYPVNAAGDKVYAFGAFPDWDSSGVRFAREFMQLKGLSYIGYEDFVYNNEDCTKVIEMCADNSEYYQGLKFYNKAYRLGIFDPDSATQNWDTYSFKLQNGQYLFAYWPWAVSPVTSDPNVDGKPSLWAPIPVGDLKINLSGYGPYGGGNWYGLGSKAKYPERVMEFYNWLCSDEGTLLRDGIVEGVTYVMKDGQPYRTDFARNTDQNKEAPASLGGGSWASGSSWINLGFLDLDNPNSLLNGLPGNVSLWPSVQAEMNNKWINVWRDKYKVNTPNELYRKYNQIIVTPGCDYSADEYPTEIINYTNQLKNIVVPAGWQMIYAKTDAEFDSIWKEMKSKLN
ncbi:MAG: hypothetical protein LBG22_10365, partial [Treponema sp.]|nr:hypothetical protein [Treponema sp.]